MEICKQILKEAHVESCLDQYLTRSGILAEDYHTYEGEKVLALCSKKGFKHGAVVINNAIEKELSKDCVLYIPQYTKIDFVVTGSTFKLIRYDPIYGPENGITKGIVILDAGESRSWYNAVEAALPRVVFSAIIL